MLGNAAIIKYCRRAVVLMEWESLQGGKKGNRQGFHFTGRCLDAQKVHIINIYPPCDVQHRRELWESLKQLKNMNPDGIWCLMGDFNSIRNTSERVGLSQKGVEDRHMTDFNEWIADLE